MFCRLDQKSGNSAWRKASTQIKAKDSYKPPSVCLNYRVHPLLPNPGATALRLLSARPSLTGQDAHRSVAPPSCPRLGMSSLVLTMVTEHEWKMISCVGLTTGALLPRQVLGSWAKGALPPQAIPALIFLLAALRFLTAPE